MDIALPGDGKDSTNGEGTGPGAKKSSATRMVTRLRNPDSKLSQLKNQQVAAAVHEANKGFKEGREVRNHQWIWAFRLYMKNWCQLPNMGVQTGI